MRTRLVRKSPALPYGIPVPGILNLGPQKGSWWGGAGGGKVGGWTRGWADGKAGARGRADGKAGAGAGSLLLNTKASQVATSPGTATTTQGR